MLLISPSPPRQTDLSWRGVCGSGAAKNKTLSSVFMEVAEAQPLAVLWLGETRERDRERKSEKSVRRSRGLRGRGDRKDRTGKGKGAEEGRSREAGREEISWREQEATC